MKLNNNVFRYNSYKLLKLEAKFLTMVFQFLEIINLDGLNLIL